MNSFCLSPGPHPSQCGVSHLDPAVTSVYVLEADLQFAVGFLDQVLHFFQEQVIIFHAENFREEEEARRKGEEGRGPAYIATAAGTSGLHWADEATSGFKVTFAKATGVKGRANSPTHVVFAKVMNK